MNHHDPEPAGSANAGGVATDEGSGANGRPAADPVWLSSFLGRHFPEANLRDALPEESVALLQPWLEADSGPELKEAALSYRQFRLHHQAGDSAEVEAWLASFPGSALHALVFRDLHLSDPQAASRLAEAVTAWPEPGTEFLGFRLLNLLGRGAFGKVFLAEQGELANRHVALKVTTDLADEAQTLAQLHHPHIVPIYSVHRSGPFRAVCMP